MAAHQPQQPMGAAGAAQYSLPKYTPEELFVQKKQTEEIQKDVRHFVQLDTAAPFANLQDAVMRLLPFHLFNAADPAAADLDDTPDHMGANLMASRQEAWEELCIAKANDLRRRADTHSSSIADLEARLNREALSGTRSIDHYAMAKLQQEDLKHKIAADKAMLAKLAPPVVPAAVPTAAGIGAAGAGKAAHPAAGNAGFLGLAGQQAMQAAGAKLPVPRPGQPMLMPGNLNVLQLQQLALQQRPQLQQAIAQAQLLQQLALQGNPAALAALQQQQQQQQQQLIVQAQMQQLLAAQKKS